MRTCRWFVHSLTYFATAFKSVNNHQICFSDAQLHATGLGRPQSDQDRAQGEPRRAVRFPHSLESAALHNRLYSTYLHLSENSVQNADPATNEEWPAVLVKRKFPKP